MTSAKTLLSPCAWHSSRRFPRGLDKALWLLAAWAALTLTASAQIWTNTGSMTSERSSYTATLLPDGKVLVVGGLAGVSLSSAELYDPVTGNWTPTGSMMSARAWHTATLLPNGKVLVAGGENNSSGYLSSAELYDPATGNWTPTGSMTIQPSKHIATLLPNGKVLVAGGRNDYYLSSAELYDPATGNWTPTGSMMSARAFHTATLLPDGKVLVAGGNSLSSTELYDPATGNWTPTGSMTSGRERHTATLLPNGKVLVAGGVGFDYLSGAELYDPAIGNWTPTGSMTIARVWHTATLLPNSKVLVAGGGGFGYLSGAELYDPAAGTWTTTGSMTSTRLIHTATLLLNGKVLVAGGNVDGGFLSSAELFLSLPLHITSDIAQQSVVIGSNATFQVVASGNEPFSYQWYYTNADPQAVARASAQIIASFVYGAVVTNGGYGYATPPGVQFVGSGSGAAAYATVSNGSVTAITVTNAGFGYTEPTLVVIDPPSGPLSSQTNSSLTVSNVNLGSLGAYWVVVANSSGSVTSSVAGITLLYPPSIAVPPANTNTSLHGAAVLSVVPAGTPPFQYQWTLAGTNLPSATNSTLELTDFRTNDVGSYTVTVTSLYGSVTSGEAQVGMLPSLTSPFTGGIQLWGQPVTLTVGAIGTGALQYQWYYNGQPINYATNQTLNFSSIQFTNAGLYGVVVSSSLGNVTNAPYQVVVNPANISLGLFPGVIINGTVGYSYGIEATTDLSNTNGWVTMTNLTLTQPLQIWYDGTADTTQPGNPRKFYRVVAGQ